MENVFIIVDCCFMSIKLLFLCRLMSFGVSLYRDVSSVSWRNNNPTQIGSQQITFPKNVLRGVWTRTHVKQNRESLPERRTERSRKTRTESLSHRSWEKGIWLSQLGTNGKIKSSIANINIKQVRKIDTFLNTIPTIMRTTVRPMSQRCPKLTNPPSLIKITDWNTRIPFIIASRVYRSRGD